MGRGLTEVLLSEMGLCVPRLNQGKRSMLARPVRVRGWMGGEIHVHHLQHNANYTKQQQPPLQGIIKKIRYNIMDGWSCTQYIYLYIFIFLIQ